MQIYNNKAIDQNAKNTTKTKRLCKRPYVQCLSYYQNLYQSVGINLLLFSHFISLYIDSYPLMESQKKYQLWAKGSGSAGCLNTHSLQDSAEFNPLLLPFQPRLLALSGSFALATDQNQTAYIWGTLGTEVMRPKIVKEKTFRISCGWNHAILQCSDGLWGIGSNTYGELGVGDKFSKEPIKLGIQKIEHFICGFRQSYVISNNTLLVCGESKKYQLGVQEKKPIQWRSICNSLKEKIGGEVVKMAVGKLFLLLLTNNGQVWALGQNQQNCLNQKITHFAQLSLIFKGIKTVVTGWAHIVLLRQNGVVSTYGRNNLHQLGREEGESDECRFELEEGESVKSVVSGTEFSFAVTSRGRLFGWGWNQHRNIVSQEVWSLSSPTLVKVPGKCLEVWTHPATTVVRIE